MKIAIYSPYLDTFGGGERYMMTIVEVLSQRSFDVSVLLNRYLYNFGAAYLKKELSKRFNLNLSQAKFIKGPVGDGSGFLERYFFLRDYDILFYLTDGSIFIPSAKRNILHIQTPLVGQPAKSWWGKVKLNGWDMIIYNSCFTQKWSQMYWPLPSQVVYPPVDVSTIKPSQKSSYILSVGRFFGYLKDKKHEPLIKTFKKLYRDKRLKGWSLHLVGSAGAGDKPYIKQLKKLAQNLPVNFYPNLGYDDLLKLYGQSSIYWHASGYGEEDPTKMEHFGITTCEAMAGGCVPVVIGKGGQTEIVEHGKSGFLWNSLGQLEEFTLQLIENKKLWQKISGKAKIRAKNFSKEKFIKKILGII